VTARLQATSAALRGSDSRFGVGGTLRGATRAVPDVVVSIDITPRNINLPR
jgi:hypothetical protein